MTTREARLRRLGRRVGVLASLLLLTAIAGVAHRQLADFRSDVEWNDHTYRVIEAIDRTRVTLGAADAMRRTYRMGFDQSDKDALQALIAEVRQRLLDLEVLTRDNPSQGARITTLRPILQEREVILVAGLDLPRAAPQADRDRQREIQARGLVLIRESDRVFVDMLAEEQRLLTERQARSIASARRTDRTILAGGAVGLALVGFFFVSLDTENRRRVRVQRELQETVVRLEEQAAQIHALNERLRVEAAYDPLTDLFNRRYLDEMLDREISRAKRKSVPVSVVMVDLDHFKRVNDTYGHRAGDDVLRQFARLLLSSIRREDVACRYGGEEFVVILPEASLESAYDRAAEWRKFLTHMQVESGGKKIALLSASFGVAAFPIHGLSGSRLLEAADRALYQAKTEGRNRVIVAESFTSLVGA